MYITLNKVLHVFDFQLEDWYYHFEFAAYTMAYSNSVLNPIIYAGFNENFKQGKHQWNTCKILQKKPVNLKQFIPKMVGLYTHEVIWSVKTLYFSI